MIIDYKAKYLKYKQKYIEVKNIERTENFSLQIGIDRYQDVYRSLSLD